MITAYVRLLEKKWNYLQFFNGLSIQTLVHNWSLLGGVDGCHSTLNIYQQNVIFS